ncbi:MAG: lysophospholipid acyltransferase family protein [Myxococcota bacterium]
MQRWKNTVIYWVIVCAIAVARRFPLWLLRWWGAWAGRLAGLLAVGERRRAVNQLAESLPALEPRFHRRIADEMFEHLGVSAVEVLKADRLFASGGGPVLSAEQQALVAEALSEGKGMVLVGGHIGNWELLSHAYARAGLPINAIAKPLYDPRLTALVDRMRRQFGTKILWRGQASVGKDMLRVFKRGEILGLLIDQDTKVQGTFVPFFGRLAYTPIAAAALALRFEAPIILSWAHRYPDGFDVHVERFRFTPSGDGERDASELTGQLTEQLEKAIRRVPAQWVWLHKRWKTRPPSGDTTQP